MKKVLFLLLAMCLMLTGCGKKITPATINPTDKPAGKPPEITAKLNDLKTASSYSEVFERINTYLNDRNNDWKYSSDMAVEETAKNAAEAPAEEPAAMAAGAEEYVGGDDYSETNVQVEGIDEADIVKTDGKYIFCLFGGTLKIYETDGPRAEKVFEKDAFVDDGESGRYFNNMYLTGDSLVLVGNAYDYSEGRDHALVAVYDVSDRRSPKQVEEFGQSGYVSSTRLVGDNLYVISTYNIWQWDAVEDEPETYCPVLYRGGEKGVVPVKDICIPEEINSTSWLTVASYSISGRERLDAETMLGRADNVYMSGDNIYVAENVWVNEKSEPFTQDQYTVVDYTDYSKTNIYKFAYSQGQVDYLCSGVVVGSLLDQFSLDEYEGNLRVVTTRRGNSYREYTDEKYGFHNYEYGDNSLMDNGLYVFDKDMKVIGSVEHLGEDERVYSTRFNGPVGYFVTFRETDPLFAVDLSDPANPTVLSALKINGFSQYLHPWGGGMLLGLGMEADDEGMVETMKLSMFDVSDPTDVTEKDKLVLPYWYSNGLYDHHAVFVDVERGLVGFGFEGESSQGYVLYKYGDGGFAEFTEIKGDDYAYDARGLRIGDYFFILTYDNVRVVDLSSGNIVGSAG